MQKVVRARADGATFLLRGDPLQASDPAMDGAALPALLQSDWSIESVHMTASAGVNGEQHAAFFVLRRGF